ncbi:mRNA-decapping enzyme-like protein [Escovopsis weberi]|uniref:mRNA-decapping enzyme-like protein n=1 Tax=Escovopsis weberi TaxID=150374 RepID=A0A0M8N7W0_ESCWE|nr:mRNA-decapping enzyme-like protein [Escovopsis weberi]
MSRATPSRKPRHNRHPSNRIPAVSDYESDIAPMQAAYAAPPPRTNTALNLSVLQRYLPSITSILSIAANAVIYTFDTAAEGWEKSGIEGTMFVCAQAGLPGEDHDRPRACVFVLNRRGLDNVIVDLARVSHVEIAGELVILKVEGDWNESEKVLGVWIHNDEEATRATNGAIIEESWKIARAARTVEREGAEAGPAMQAIGRPLSINELFAMQGYAGHS